MNKRQKKKLLKRFDEDMDHFNEERIEAMLSEDTKYLNAIIKLGETT